MSTRVDMEELQECNDREGDSSSPGYWRFSVEVGGHYGAAVKRQSYFHCHCRHLNSPCKIRNRYSPFIIPFWASSRQLHSMVCRNRYRKLFFFFCRRSYVVVFIDIYLRWRCVICVCNGRSMSESMSLSSSSSESSSFSSECKSGITDRKGPNTTGKQRMANVYKSTSFLSVIFHRIYRTHILSHISLILVK